MGEALFFSKMRPVLLNTAFNDNMAMTEWTLSRSNVSKHLSLTSNWKLQTRIKQSMVQLTSPSKQQLSLRLHIHQSVTQNIVMSSHDTKKQAWISNVAAEMPPDWQTEEATAVRNISHLRPRIGSRCAWYILTLFMLLCQYLTKPLWSAVNIHKSLWLQIIVRTAVSWAYTSHRQTYLQLLASVVGQGSRPDWPWWPFSFNTLRAMAVTHTCAKGQSAWKAIGKMYTCRPSMGKT